MQRICAEAGRVMSRELVSEGKHAEMAAYIYDAELQVARVREILRDPELYDAYNSVALRCLVRDIKQAMGIPLDSTRVPEPESAHCAAIDAAHLERQREFSASTFGPGQRTDSVLDHIVKDWMRFATIPATCPSG